MNPRIVSIGYAVPDHSYTQEQIFKQLKYPRLFKKLFTESGIEKRHFWVPLEQIPTLTFQQQQEEYAKGAVYLSERAILSCMDGSSRYDIGCIVFASCTGFMPGPTVPHYIIKDLGFRPNIYVTNIASMGCEAGYPGLKRATDFVIANNQPALVCACELSSVSYYPECGGPDPENHYELMRANAIFGDAASAVIVSYSKDRRYPEIVSTETYTDVKYISDLGYIWKDGRLRLKLSKNVPDAAAKMSGIVVRRLLVNNSLNTSDITHWIVHPGGALILDKIRDELKLDEVKMVHARKSLRLYGNTSSTSIGIIGKFLMADGKPKPGDTAVIVSIGPGLTAGATLLRW